MPLPSQHSYIYSFKFFLSHATHHKQAHRAALNKLSNHFKQLCITSPFMPQYVYHVTILVEYLRKRLPQQIRHWYDGLILVGKSVLNELGNPGILQLQKVW